MMKAGKGGPASWLQVFVLFTAQFFFAFSLYGASGPESLYLEGIKAYQSGNYDRAAEIFLQVAEAPVENGELYYNLGNAFYKKGDLGRSVLWYERALKLMPTDPDLQFNHQLVTGLVVDKADNRSNPLADVFLFWKHRMSRQATVWSAVLLFAAFTWLSLVRIVKPSRSLKYTERTALAFSLVFIVSASYDFYSDRFNRQAVVVSQEAVVRSGLSDDATELFRLHDGTKVSVREELRGYVKIRFSDDKVGWVDKKNIEII